MAYEAKILADSICEGSPRLTTFEITYPRCVHAEFMTHRVFSRNSASSRAIPVEKMLARIESDPFVPIDWGKNQRGMQAGEQLSESKIEACKRRWLNDRWNAVQSARYLDSIGLHKQIVNRLVEPWMWITVIVSSTEYENWFKLRCHPDAEPHIRRIAEMMRDLYRATTPRELAVGAWHLPLLVEADEGLLLDEVVKVCVGRCARVSYLTHDGRRDPAADIELHDRLAKSGHWSPFEHVAMACPGATRSMAGNFGWGWGQYRKTFQGESGVPARTEAATV